MLLLFSVSTFGQQSISESQYQTLKSNGGISPNSNYTIQSNSTPSSSTQPSTRAANNTTGCGCYTEPDASYTLAMTPNDDLSTSLLTLPFNFCFYGTTMNSVFINNNGNISFGTPFSTYSGVGFPSTQYQMIAPFWGDVDTRGVGEVWYKMTNSALIVNWVEVGYFNSMSDKKNTFQLIITDGSDPLIANGNNVAFCYQDMQWTTGGASGGTNGFGGTPATVGANKGDGIDFLQMGRFDTAGTAYDGPYNGNDGVDWLDNQSFVFNTCNSTNIPPIATGLDLCDTLGICIGDTLNFDISFLAPEQTQITTANVITTTPGFNLISNTTGVNADVSAQLIGSNANMGYNTIQFMAFDNGMPADTTYIDLVVYVDTTQVFPEITGDSIACVGETVTLDAGTGYDSYQWNTDPNDVNQTNTVTAGEYVVTVTKGYCSKAADTFNVELLILDPGISGDTAYCAGDSVLLTVVDTFDTYLWRTGDTDTNAYAKTPGYLRVDVEKFGCTGFDSVLIVELALPTPVISGDTFYCYNDSTTLNVATFPQINWSTGGNGTSVRVGAGKHAVTVIDDEGCDNTSDSVNVIQVIPDGSVTGDSMICAGTTTVFEAAASNVSFNWSDGSTDILDTVTIGQYSLTVTDAYGCSDTTTFEVFEAPEPVTSFTTDPVNLAIKDEVVNFINQTTLLQGNIAAWDWDFGDQLGSSTDENPDYTYGDTGTYKIRLEATSEDGCSHFYELEILVVDNVITPNVITPNGDGINDYLVFKFIEPFEGSHLYIYNRWGELIYETDNYQNNWDGRNMNDGTYFYVLELGVIDHVEKGTFTLMKE